eukprot:TRINITY_DN15055_c0_g1_i2.p1 TRINITY_DN15055_c0_g1~~TRINITY_DN15055_c0_g1_i2.p1  ORF type:complete len:456 (-),score=97.58 TRINITY_DN15055_c0_g1_i2:239-1561(-)
MLRSLVGSEMCIRDRYQRRVRGLSLETKMASRHVLAVWLVMGISGAEKWGHKLLSHWQMADGYMNLNHGSYGATPTIVTEARHRWYSVMEARPDYWFRYNGNNHTLYGALDEVRERVGRMINAKNASEVVFVDNASGGMNAVLRSIRLGPDDEILYLNVAYGMVKSTIKYVYHHDDRERPSESNITIPSSEAMILTAVENTLKKNPAVKLASFSHITSIPAIILPVKKLAALCKQHGVMVLIDGAHALGQIPIDVADIGADFYVANGHKWLYSPKGSAILWVTPGKQSLIHPNIISYEGQGKTEFQLEFSYVGTKDYSSFLAMADAIDFRNTVLGGDAAIMKYIHELAVQGGQLLQSVWQTEELTTPDWIGAMANVRLPDGATRCCSTLADKLFVQSNVWVPFYTWNHKCWVRVSAQVYNEISDFAFLGKAVLNIVQTNC